MRTKMDIDDVRIKLAKRCPKRFLVFGKAMHIEFVVRCQDEFVLRGCIVYFDIASDNAQWLFVISLVYPDSGRHILELHVSKASRRAIWIKSYNHQKQSPKQLSMKRKRGGGNKGTHPDYLL